MRSSAPCLSPTAATDGYADSHGWLIGSLIFLFWATLFLSWPGHTLHTVDNVRDFRVALDIASGKTWPTASQPFAGQWQLPPLYFHLLALPLRLWPNEQAVFVFSGLIAAGAIAVLALAIHRHAGWFAATIYAALAAPPHAAVIFAGVSNPSLAFSFVTLMIASWFHLRARPATATPAMLATGWCAVLMHPSAAVIVVPLFIASAVAARAGWRERSTWVVALLLAVATLAWVAQNGLLAPEAARSGHSGIDWAAAVTRLFSASQWVALWTPPWAHVLELRDFHPPGSTPLVAIAAATMALGLILATVSRRKQPRWEQRALLLAVVGAVPVATATLSTWGFWYLDALWPAFASLAALGWSALRAHRPTAGAALALFAAVAAISLPLLVKAVVVGTERYSIGVSGLFLPGGDRTETLDIPLASAMMRYRTFVSGEGGCDSSRFVGIDEFWLRDLTLRFAISDCVGIASRSLDRPRFLVRTDGGAGSSAAVRRFGDIRLAELHAATITIDGAASGELQSWQPGLRYSYYEPADLRAGVEIHAVRTQGDSRHTAGVDDDARSRMVVAFRCLQQDATRLEQSLVSPTTLTLARQRELRPFQYFEFQIPFDGSGRAVVATRSALKCDVAAWSGEVEARPQPTATSAPYER